MMPMPGTSLPAAFSPEGFAALPAQCFMAQGLKRPRDDLAYAGACMAAPRSPSPPTAVAVAAMAHNQGTDSVPEQHQVVGASYAALSRLVTMLHGKVPALRFDVALASSCADVLTAAITDATHAASLGQSVAAMAARPLAAQMEALMSENEKLRRCIADQKTELDGLKDMARCLELVCRSTSTKKRKALVSDAAAAQSGAPSDKERKSPVREGSVERQTPDTPPWFAPSLDLPFALPSVPEINLCSSKSDSGLSGSSNKSESGKSESGKSESGSESADEEQDEEITIDVPSAIDGDGDEEIGDLLVKDLKFHGFDAICARSAAHQGSLAAASANCDSYVGCGGSSAFATSSAAFVNCDSYARCDPPNASTASTSTASAPSASGSVSALSGYESATLGACPWATWGGA